MCSDARRRCPTHSPTAEMAGRPPDARAASDKQPTGRPRCSRAGVGPGTKRCPPSSTALDKREGRSRSSRVSGTSSTPATHRSTASVHQGQLGTAHTSVMVSASRNPNAARSRKPRRPESPTLLASLRRAGAAKAEGAPPLTQAQIDRIVAILRLAGPRSRR